MNENKDSVSLVNDLREERYVIGSILAFNNAYTIVYPYLDEDCFYNFVTKELWKVIDCMSKKCVPVDILSVTAELEKLKSSITPLDVVNISQAATTIVNLEYHAKRLKELSVRRKFWVVGEKLIKAGLSESDDIASVQQATMDSVCHVLDKSDGVFTLTDAMNSLNQIIVQNSSADGILTGTKTGLDKFDEKGG